ncbi:MAG: hypothetical protein NWE96_10490 [Candidatus Bathyarchaeota archaeon]|nr:hypothetical protein [Candidatus Bathyarchaeota archaeon]
MNKQGLAAFFHSQYSAQGLKYRASLIQHIDNPYPKLLLLLAELRESKKIGARDAKTLVKAARLGKWDRVVYCLNAVYSMDQIEQRLGLSKLSKLNKTDKNASPKILDPKNDV